MRPSSLFLVPLAALQADLYSFCFSRPHRCIFIYCRLPAGSRTVPFQVICSSAPALGSCMDASCLLPNLMTVLLEVLRLECPRNNKWQSSWTIAFPWVMFSVQESSCVRVSELLLNVFLSVHQASFALKMLMNVSSSPTLVRMEVPAPTTMVAMPVSVSMVGVGTTAVRTLMIASLLPVLMDPLALIEWLLFHAFVQKERQVRTENLYRSGT